MHMRFRQRQLKPVFLHQFHIRKSQLAQKFISSPLEKMEIIRIVYNFHSVGVTVDHSVVRFCMIHLTSSFLLKDELHEQHITYCTSCDG